MASTSPTDSNYLSGLSSTGRAHKKLSSGKKYQSGRLTKTERLRTTSAIGSASNSPRPSVSSETESSEYTSSEEDSDYSSDDDEIMDLRTLEEVSGHPIRTQPHRGTARLEEDEADILSIGAP